MKRRKLTGHKTLSAIIAVALIVFFVSGVAYTAGLEGVPTPLTHVGKKVLLDAVTSDGSGTAYDIYGFGDLVFHVAVAGTATVALEVAIGGVWYELTSTTATSSHAFPKIRADQVRATVSGCAACTVSTTVYGGK